MGSNLYYLTQVNIIKTFSQIKGTTERSIQKVIANGDLHALHEMIIFGYNLMDISLPNHVTNIGLCPINFLFG